MCEGGRIICDDNSAGVNVCDGGETGEESRETSVFEEERQVGVAEREHGEEEGWASKGRYDSRRDNRTSAG